MKNIKTLILVTLSASLLFNSCIVINDNDDSEKDDRVIVGSGDLVDHTLNLPEFHKISNTGIMDITLSKGTSQSIVVKAQENLFSYLTFEVENGTLVISKPDHINFNTDKGMKGIMVYQNTIDRIDVVGTGNIDVTGNKQENLSLNIVGTGNVHAYGLEVNQCDINSTGIGNCEVFVNNNLNVNLLGTGSVFYKGYPKISQNILGVGAIIDKNE